VLKYRHDDERLYDERPFHPGLDAAAAGWYNSYRRSIEQLYDIFL